MRVLEKDEGKERWERNNGKVCGYDGEPLQNIFTSTECLGRVSGGYIHVLKYPMSRCGCAEICTQLLPTCSGRGCAQPLRIIEKGESRCRRQEAAY